MQNSNMKNILIWALIFMVLVYFGKVLFDNVLTPYKDVSLSEFLHKVEAKQVKQISVRGNHIEGVEVDGNKFHTYYENYPTLMDRLQNYDVNVNVIPPDNTVQTFLSVLYIAGLLMMGFAGIYSLKQMQGGMGGKAFGFGSSKAKLLSEKANKVTFKDVAGIEEAKEELTEMVEFLRDPGKFHKLGGKIPKGCLLVGPPGTGKTLLARAIAGEANVPFFSISGSDFVEMFVGVGASRVRDMFAQAKRSAPCIIFIDEIDAVGRHRGIGLGGGNDEREQTLNQLLVEMDGFESNEGVIIIAATNRPDVLDAALLRPGRFDRQITVSNPDVHGREKILGVHLKKVKCASKIDINIIARGTPGFSGAELANLVNEAALLAARRNKTMVDINDLDDAKDKVLMGVERRSMFIHEDEKKKTAYHESGHAIVGVYSKAADPIHKATIIPRGRALGLVMQLPKDDRLSLTLEQMKAKMAVAMGGRVAEELIFGLEKVTSGASQDIKMATNLANAMVTEWGLSEELGPVNYSSTKEDVYSRSSSHEKSEYIQQRIDQEIKRFVNEAYIRAKNILTAHIDELHILAKGLVEHETLSGQQIKNLLSGRDLNDTSEITLISKVPD